MRAAAAAAAAATAEAARRAEERQRAREERILSLQYKLSELAVEAETEHQPQADTGVAETEVPPPYDDGWSSSADRAEDYFDTITPEVHHVGESPRRGFTYNTIISLLKALPQIKGGSETYRHPISVQLLPNGMLSVGHMQSLSPSTDQNPDMWVSVDGSTVGARSGEPQSVVSTSDETWKAGFRFPSREINVRIPSLAGAIDHCRHGDNFFVSNSTA